MLFFNGSRGDQKPFPPPPIFQKLCTIYAESKKIVLNQKNFNSYSRHLEKKFVSVFDFVDFRNKKSPFLSFPLYDFTD